MDYYQIKITEVDSKEPFDLNEVRFCLCCQQVVDQIGAGEGFICKPCKHILDTGALANVFSEIKTIIKRGQLPTEPDGL